MDINNLTTLDEMCKGNPGALSFIMEAYHFSPFGAEECMQRMKKLDITGDKLYMLWSDCCSRDTELTLTMMEKASDEQLSYYLNYEHGRGRKFSLENLKED